MRRIATVMAAAATMAVVTGVFGAQLALAATCTGKSPTKLAWTRKVGHTAGVLRWAAPVSHPANFSYRILRNGTIVGQTKVRAYAIKVTPGRAYVFGVRIVSSTGSVSPCHNSVRVQVIYHHPVAPKTTTLASRTPTQIAISWGPGASGDGRLVGYRVLRNGAVVGQTTKRSYTLTNLFSSTAYTVTVRAVDSRGMASVNSPAVRTETLAPVPSTGTAHAFLLATTDQSFRDFESHYRRIGVLYPTYYDCRADDSIVGSNDKLVTSWAQARDVEVLPRINCQNQAVLHDILTDPTKRAAVLSQLVGLVTANGYDGLNVDFEAGAASDRAALTSFVTDLATDLHAVGKKVSVCVAPAYYNQLVGRQGFYDYKALGAVADYIFVMGWGKHWATSGPGSIDDITWERQVVTYLDTMPLESKYILGLGLYGVDWPDGGGSANPGTPLEYQSVVALMDRVHATPAMDPTALSPHFSYTQAGVAHDVWYQNAASINQRIELARSNGLSVGFWHLGEEDPGLWALTGIG